MLSKSKQTLCYCLLALHPKRLGIQQRESKHLIVSNIFLFISIWVMFFCFVFEDMILFLSKSDSMTNVPRQFFKLPQQFRDNPEPNQIGRDQI